MQIAIKSKIPFLFLLGITFWWAIYYRMDGPLNDFGKANFEWLYLIDALITLPILCFVFIEEKKQALFKALVLAGTAVFIGSIIIPPSNQIVLPYLEDGRYLLLLVILVIEITTLATVCMSIRAALSKGVDPDVCIERPISKLFGKGTVAKLLSFEARMWTFALFASRVKPESFQGQMHFSYHRKDGAKSNLLGFVILIALEIPIVHLLLHFLWSPLAANIITGLTLIGLVFFFAEYRAVSRRPISIVDDVLVIRFGLYPAFSIPLSNISAVQMHGKFVKRSRTTKRFNYNGKPNIAIELMQPQGQTEMVYLGVDHPQRLLIKLKSKITDSLQFVDSASAINADFSS